MNYLNEENTIEEKFKDINPLKIIINIQNEDIDNKNYITDNSNDNYKNIQKQKIIISDLIIE